MCIKNVNIKYALPRVKTACFFPFHSIQWQRGKQLMLIWINGARGCGKTQTAAELCRRTEHSFFYDPEEIGYCLRKTTPKALWHDDFQDNPLWRAMNITMLKKLCRDYDGAIVLPMMVMNEAYLNEILGALRADTFINSKKFGKIRKITLPKMKNLI